MNDLLVFYKSDDKKDNSNYILYIEKSGLSIRLELTEDQMNLLHYETQLEIEKLKKSREIKYE